MARWDPGTEQRLIEAALDLFQERGYDAVTVSDIAERAGITRRSYFRHFPDKREVLFANAGRLPVAVGEAVLTAGADVPALTAALHALTEAGTYLTEHVEHARERLEIIKASPELQERDRSKSAALSAALHRALEQRGVTPAVAKATAQVTTIAFTNAYEEWVQQAGGGTFSECLEAATAALRSALID